MVRRKNRDIQELIALVSRVHVVRVNKTVCISDGEVSEVDLDKTARVWEATTGRRILTDEGLGDEKCSNTDWHVYRQKPYRHPLACSKTRNQPR